MMMKIKSEVTIPERQECMTEQRRKGMAVFSRIFAI